MNDQQNIEDNSVLTGSLNNAKEVFREAARNIGARWSYGDIKRDSDPTLAINRIGNGYFVPNFTPKFKVRRDAVFFLIGSCFARELEIPLLKMKRDVPSRLEDIEGNPLFLHKNGVSIHQYFNRYNVPSIAEEVENISSRVGCTLEDKLIYESADGQYDDLHYTPAAVAGDMVTILERRKWLWKRLSEGYARADVVVLTLGLSEAWFDTKSGKYLNVVSSPQMLRRYSDDLQIRFIGFTEAQRYLGPAIDRLRKDGKKVVLTVSPVPLQNTFLGEDIVIANHASKSNLRALAVEVAQNNEDVDYFPSFEMVHFSDKSMAWKSDGRHVQMGMIEAITSKALSSYLQQ
ncbi:GSCFA domain-containing protein [Agrobacterium bohemicum]|uniref:GSCFA domain-containing protein n=1 Tax=Agrobacterium bohemicum TaxID=2052828 RepID=A0A135P7N2_9HYPH|nr:GSCFA domain-containing protein [Agrobacterium bohemicum]KXG87406.1 hypothetical protein ATO67_19010 [Agrobacterium bohemicum]